MEIVKREVIEVMTEVIIEDARGVLRYAQDKDL